MILSRFLLVILFFQFFTSVAWSKIDCKIEPQVQNVYLKWHALYSKKSPEIQKRAEERALFYLDAAKTYFNQSDVKQIKSMIRASKNGCKEFKAIYNILLKKMDATLKVVRKELQNKKFKINPSTKVTIDYKERKYAKDELSRIVQLKKFLQFQVQSRLEASDNLEDAKKRTLSSYERIYRQAKSKTLEDIAGLHLKIFAATLDPHSSYLTREELEDFNISMSLSLEGIGTTLSFEDGYTVVVDITPGGAAEKSGLIRSKDKIIAVGQGKNPKKWEDIFEKDLKDVVQLIRGPKGTTVNLRILRKVNGKNKRFDISLVREKINLKDKAAALYFVTKKHKGKDHKVAIVHLPSFYYSPNKRRASLDIYKLINKAKKQNAVSLVLDLSTNSGGSLDDAVRVAGLFMKKPIVVRQAKNGSDKKGSDLTDPDPSVSWSGPLVTLISRQSASASEIVSGALQDYKRAVVVGGRQTYGKGTVQVVQQVNPRGVDLGAIKVTIGMFFIPSGKSTQGVGVESDIIIPEQYELVLDEKDIGEKSQKYSLPPQKMAAFLSPAHKSWLPAEQINQSIITKLAAKSRKRVQRSKGFKEILAKAKKLRKDKDKKVWRLSELKSKQSEEGKDKEKQDKEGTLTAKQKADKYLAEAKIQEATNVALDLWQILEKPAAGQK